MNRIKWLISALLLITSPALVHAWSSEEIFSHFQPYITVQEEYNSNIDLSQNRYKRDDFITTISPGFKFSTTPRSPITGEFRPTPTAEERYGMDLDFRAGYTFYAKHHGDNYINLNGLLNAWYAVTPRLNFRVRDYVIRSDEIREADYSSTSIEGQYLPSRTEKRGPYIRNVFEPSVQYQFGRENILAFNYRNNVYHIQSRTSEDSMENYFNPKITYWFDIRNGVSLEYGLTLGNFQGSPDLVGHMGTGRYTYRFNPRTSLFGEYTQMWRNFNNPGTDYVVYRPTLGVEHAFSPTLSVRIQGGYYWSVPKEGSTVDGPSFDVLLTQRGKRTIYTLSFQGGYTEDYFTSDNQGFTQYYRALGRVTYQLLSKMNVGLFGSYEWLKYSGQVTEDKTPKDQIWAVGVNASYQILKWLNASLDVSHRENRSNISDRNYSEYRGMIKVTATYNK
jgi:predicted porin